MDLNVIINIFLIQTTMMARLVSLWASYRVEVFNAFLQFGSAIFVVLAKGSLAPALAGVALTNALAYVLNMLTDDVVMQSVAMFY